MSLGMMVLLLAGVFIAYFNGANDVSKGIATLVGGGVTNYKRAILWGTTWTGFGGLAGALLAGAMIETFGSGLLAGGTSPTLDAAAATIAGAGLWVLIATRLGLPVSTTHAIVGSLAGVGATAYGVTGFQWTALGGKIALPLLLSPVVALLLTTLIIRSWNRLQGETTAGGADCICLVMEPPELLADVNTVCCSTAAVSGVKTGIVVARESECKSREAGTLSLSFNSLHWLTSGGASFARGMNDAPKMVALILAAGAVTGQAVFLHATSFVMVAVAMMAGSWLAGRRVTGVMAEKITPMDHQEGFIANLVTAALVGPGAALGLPMSTTHVSSGAIMGIGSQSSGRLNGKTVRGLLLAWAVTLPAAAVLGIVVYQALQVLGLA